MATSRVYCLDADVIIWHLRNVMRRTSVTADLAPLAQSGTLVCSTITIAEVEQGVKPGEEEKTRSFLQVLDAYPADRAIAERAGELVRELRTRGVTLGLADALVGATCLLHDLTLVTLNVEHFKPIPGLRLQTI